MSIKSTLRAAGTLLSLIALLAAPARTRAQDASPGGLFSAPGGGNSSGGNTYGGNSYGGNSSGNTYGGRYGANPGDQNGGMQPSVGPGQRAGMDMSQPRTIENLREDDLQSQLTDSARQRELDKCRTKRGAALQECLRAVQGMEPAQAPRQGKPGRQEPRLPTDFQQYAATSLGEIPPIFGQDLFSGVPDTFAPTLDVAPPSDYVVGAGDELVIRGWGQLDVDLHATVTREGTIAIPRVGVVTVAGLKYDELTPKLTAAFGRYYRNFHLNVSIGQLRSIQVFVVGHADRPGLYTVSSLSTLMNALFAAGGPSETGSMRRFQLRRGSSLVGEFDLYDVLLKGDKSGDQRLLTGDVIFVPPLGPVAAIVGPVKTPGVFELRAQGSTLGDLIGYAGGLSTTAATQAILLERLEQQRGHVIQELPWSDASLALPLKDGDIVQLRSVPAKFDNAITVRGSVIQPFRTAWRPGVKVSDLIPDKSALISTSYWSRVAARAYRDQAPTPKTEDKGEQRVRTEIENLVDEVNWDYAVVERLDRDRVEPRLLPFNLRKAIFDHDPASDLALQPGDVVTVFSKKEIVTPTSRQTFFVRVEGEVGTPGVYQVAPGETLRQLLDRAGGLSPKAYLFGAEFQRESVRKSQQARLEEMVTRAEQDLERSSADRLARALSADDAQSIRGEVQAQRQSLERMKALQSTGRMVLGLTPEAHSVGDLPDLVLEDADRFFVPAQYSTVAVYGAVYNQTDLIYRPNHKVDDYLSLAGGPTRSADDGSTYVLRADGSVISKRQTGWFSSFGHKVLAPNDSIIVPEDYSPTSWVKELKDWSQIFYQFGLGVAALEVLRR